MEAGDPSVSVDLMMKSLFCVGVSTKQVAKTIAITDTARRIEATLTIPHTQSDH